MAVQVSIYTAILKAVQQSIITLDLDNSPAVIRRKNPIIGLDDTLPLILVTPEKEKQVREDNRGIFVLDYPVLVTIALVGNQLLETNVDTLLDWREAIRWELNKPTMTGVPSVIDCNIELNPAFEMPRYKSELDASAIRFTYRSSETWNKNY